jgi:hypothetical protein
VGAFREVFRKDSPASISKKRRELVRFVGTEKYFVGRTKQQADHVRPP